MKPTSLIQISQRHIAVATGFLNERSSIEIINIFSGQQTSVLEHHEDMIDSMRLVDLSRQTHWQGGGSAHRDAGKERRGNGSTVNPHVRWLLSMGRDNKLVVWKLFDGKIMHTDAALPLYFASQAKIARKESKRFQKELNKRMKQKDLQSEQKSNHLKVQLLSVTENLPKAHRVRNSEYAKKELEDAIGSQNEAGEGVDDDDKSLMSYKQSPGKKTRENEENMNYKAYLRN